MLSPGLLPLQVTPSHPTSPTPTPQEMSDAQDPATIPAVGTQVKLRGWSRQGEGGESFHFRRHEELQAFLSLLGESTWGLARQGPWGPSMNRYGRWDLSLPVQSPAASVPSLLRWPQFGRWGVSCQKVGSGEAWALERLLPLLSCVCWGGNPSPPFLLSTPRAQFPPGFPLQRSLFPDFR